MQQGTANVPAAPDEKKYLQEFFEPMPANHDCGCEKEANPHPDNTLQLLEALGAEIAKMPSEDLFDLPVGRVRAAFQNVYDIAAGMLGVDVLARPIPPKNCECSDFPGWSRNEQFERFVGVPLPEERCWNHRTLNPDHEMWCSDLKKWWDNLTLTEREIEEALATTSKGECRDRAPFDHYEEHTYSFVMRWISDREPLIREVSQSVNIDPALVAGLLASEMLYDYAPRDKYSDMSAQIGRPISAGGGYGFSNAHLETRTYAYDYIRPLIESGYVGPVSNLMADDTLDAARWMLSDFGAATVTSVVARWLVDSYTNSSGMNYNSPKVLTSEEMAVIFTAYRAGVGGWSPPASEFAFDDLDDFRSRLATRGLPCNSILALPLMKRMKIIFP